jgi:hypothetical protein
VKQQLRSVPTSSGGEQTNGRRGILLRRPLRRRWFDTSATVHSDRETRIISGKRFGGPAIRTARGALKISRSRSWLPAQDGVRVIKLSTACTGGMSPRIK